MTKNATQSATQIGAHCRPYRLGDSEKMVGLGSWRTLCCCFRGRLCFLLRRRNYCPRVEVWGVGLAPRLRYQNSAALSIARCCLLLAKPATQWGFSFFQRFDAAFCFCIYCPIVRTLDNRKFVLTKYLHPFCNQKMCPFSKNGCRKIGCRKKCAPSIGCTFDNQACEVK